MGGLTDCDAAELLETIDTPLDQVAPLVRFAIIFNGNSPDELGSGANCSDFLDCLEVPTRDSARYPANAGFK